MQPHPHAVPLRSRRAVREALVASGYVRGDALPFPDQAFAARVLGGFERLTARAERWLAHSWFSINAAERLDRRARTYFSLPRGSIGRWRTSVVSSRIGQSHFVGRGRGRTRRFIGPIEP